MDEDVTMIETYGHESYHDKIKKNLNMKLEGITDEKLLYIKDFLKENGAFDSGYDDLIGYSVLELIVNLEEQNLMGSSYSVAVNLFLKVLKEADAANMIASTKDIINNETGHFDADCKPVINTVLKLVDAVENQQHTGTSLIILTNLFEKCIEALDTIGNQNAADDDDAMTLNDPMAKYTGDMENTIIDPK